MFSGFFTPITEAMTAVSNTLIVGLFIFGIIQIVSIVTIGVRAYYSLKIIKQVSVLLREIIVEVGQIKKSLKE
jgi:hypothetical protein